MRVEAVLLLLGGVLALGLVIVAWSMGPGSSEAQQGAMHNCPQPGMWAISVWSGDDGTDTGEALGTCGDNAVSAAYSLDPQMGGWQRWFLGRPDISNLVTVSNLQGIIALGSPSAGTVATSALSEGQGSVQWCPPAGRWAISVWNGQNAVGVDQALSTCGSGAVSAAYYLDPQTGTWLRWFGGRPDISNLAALNNLQGLIVLGSASFTLTVDKFGEGTITSSPEGIDCGPDCTLQSATFPSDTSVVLTATADPGSTFSHWTGCDSVSDNSCTVEVGGDKTVFATFAFSEVKIPETTKVLDAATMDYLMRQEGSTYYFDPRADAVADLDVGDVIVSSVGEGLLRKVVAVDVTEQEIVVETTDATLEDAIERGTVIVHKTLTPSDLQAARALDGESTGADQITSSSALPFFNQYNVGFSEGVGLRGTLSFEPTLDFAVSFDGLKPVEARSVLTFQQRTDLDLFAESSFSMGAERKIWPPPGSPSLFAPITVLVGIPPFVVPVVFVPELAVSVGVEGSSSSSVETGITLDATVVAGVHYTSQGGWNHVGDHSENFSFNPPTVSNSAELKAYVSPELSVRVYGVVGPYVNLGGYERLSADPAKTPWWALYAGLAASAGFSVDFPIIGRVLDYHLTIFQLDWLLKQAEMAPATPTPTATPTTTPTPTPTATATPMPRPTPSPAPPPFGHIAFVSSRESGNWEVYLMNTDGSDQINLTNNPATDDGPAWSPDGSKIAFSSDRDGNSEIYVMNADGTGQTRLTNNSVNDENPAWSPDGSKIAFDSGLFVLGYDIYLMDADGTGLTNITNSPGWDAYPAWSPDGSKIAFYSNRDGGNWDIYVMNADGTDQTRLTSNSAIDRYPAWSPDGPKIAFTSDREGNDDIYVMNADGTGLTNVTNSSGRDWHPAWSPDGSRIAFGSYRGVDDWEIYVMNADGTDQTKLTDIPGIDFSPAWSP